MSATHDELMGSDERTDQQLLSAHVAGDRDAFAVLLGRHRNRLWGLALRTLGNREDAADALQDALINAHRAASSFRGDSAVSTWLHRIVVNACLDRARHSRSRPSTALAPELLDGALDSVDAHSPDVGDQVSLRIDVERALAALPVDQRVALILVDVLGHSVTSAAAVLDCAEGTVKSRCSRGRARLAPLLAPYRNRASSADVEPQVTANEQPDGGEPA